MSSHGKASTKKKGQVSRRDFLASAAVGAAFTIVPRYVLGGTGYTAPSDKLNIACIGVGAMGKGDVNSVSSENIIALCDVDDRQMTAWGKENHPNARQYRDFREMLEKEDKNIDAVTVSTTDNLHAVVSIAAMKMGKHVYCQKPLSLSVYEARRMAEVARENNVVTQMGIHNHAADFMKVTVEIIKSGLIGKVREIHVWTDRPIWPQGMALPTDTPEVPKELDWDLWLGPAKERPYHLSYVPWVWRGWVGFGTGACGDMAIHQLDPAVWALDLGAPISTEAQTSGYNGDSFPSWSMINFEFGARGDLPPVTIKWYTGGRVPFFPKGFERGREWSENGSLYVGDEGTLYAPYGTGPRLIPETKMKGFRKPEPFLPRDVDHYQDWIRGCKGGPRPAANFDYSGPLTETVLLGVAAIQEGRRIFWDSEKMQITNKPDVANQFIKREFREGWSV